jgi:hypothetical protein
MSNTLFLLFNHHLTEVQEQDARNTLGVLRIVPPPEAVAALWSQIPTELESLDGYLDPVKEWLKQVAIPGDYVLIQGDFGACYLVVSFAFGNGFIPIYSATKRDAVEKPDAEGVIRITHRFNHKRFRKYGV